MHAYVCACVRACVRVCVRACMRACVHACVSHLEMSCCVYTLREVHHLCDEILAPRLITGASEVVYKRAVNGGIVSVLLSAWVFICKQVSASVAHRRTLK